VDNDPIPEEVDPIPEEVDPIPEEVDPTPEEVDPTPEEVDPTPEEVDPTPEEVDPTPEEVDPTPEEVDPTPEEVDSVRQELRELKKFAEELTGEDLKSGGWFTRLLSLSLAAYTEKVDAAYFEGKYPGLPADAVVEARISMAARYAAVAGGLSAAAYTGVVAATIGTLGGASPVAIPAAVATMMADVLSTTRLQLQLAYDIAVLYRVPLDLDDPEDLWKLIRVAFTIRAGEFAREGANKAIPLAVRPVLKLFYRGQVLAAARGLPVVGKYLLQRSVIKVGIPAVGIPLATLLNRYSTLVAGRHAREIFRNEARIIEEARRMLGATTTPRALLWVAWATAAADRKISEEEQILLHNLVSEAKSVHGVLDQDFKNLIEVDTSRVCAVVQEENGDVRRLLRAAERVAQIDGKINKRERDFLTALAEGLTDTIGPAG